MRIFLSRRLRNLIAVLLKKSNNCNYRQLPRARSNTCSLVLKRPHDPFYVSKEL